MNNILFVYLTQEDKLAKVAGISEFNPELKLSIKNPFYLLPCKLLKNKLDENDYQALEVILIYDNLGEDGVKKFCINFSIIANHFDKLYIAYHTGGELKPEDIKKDNNCDFKNKIVEKFGKHEPTDRVYSTAINFINNDKDAVQKALAVFESDILTELWKKLTLLKIKSKSENFIDYEKEMESIKLDSEKERAELNKFFNYHFKDFNKFNEDLTEFWNSFMESKKT